jgi:hypothetical protein
LSESDIKAKLELELHDFSTDDH